MMNKKIKIISLMLFLIICVHSVAQEPAYDADGNEIQAPSNKKFHVGLYMGVYFANKSTANLYDGYGFDFDGNRNNFENSFMYRKIWLENGGYGNSGQPDLIAEALSVDYHSWSFGESDMPTNMRYAPAFLLGLNTRYKVDKKNAILLNVNAVRLTINGNFTIVKPLQANTTQVNDRIQTFAIKGREQRIMFQLAYQRLLGNNEKLNFLIEAGMNVTLAKFDKNEVLINGLYIDLASSYYSPGSFNPAYVVRKPIGTGFGAFAGLGLNLSMSAKWTIQLVYNPSYEGINIVPDASLKLQNAIGLRAYYNL